MKVVSYLGGIPNARKNPEKAEMLIRFADGVNAAGDIGVVHNSRDLLQADVGVIQGWVHANSPDTKHLGLRRQVSQNTHNRHTIIIDSNLFNYTGIKTPAYHRYSMDGIFPTTGKYFWDNPDPQRWLQIRRDYNISLKDWRHPGKHILICTQRNGGWSMDGFAVVDWLHNTVQSIKQHTDRPILVRAHPGDKRANEYLQQNQGNWEISNQPSILDDFERAWCVVTYNSSPGVAAAIEGIPVFVTDPVDGGKRSQAHPVANTKIKAIEAPQFFERQQWIERICMSHWNFKELSNGSAWSHMRNYIT